jgi:hypothetical protein
MDEIVKQAMAKWSAVPHCYGWLAMDARGDYYMRDDRVQAQGRFGSSAQAKGSRVNHDKLLAFIHRNLSHDTEGCWYFQNGPQRVYLELEAAPFVWRFTPPQQPQAAYQVHAHCGYPVMVDEALLDEHGRLFLSTPMGLGLVHTQDMGLAADWLEHERLPTTTLTFAEMPARFGYVLSPLALQAARY